MLDPEDIHTSEASRKRSPSNVDIFTSVLGQYPPGQNPPGQYPLRQNAGLR